MIDTAAEREWWNGYERDDQRYLAAERYLDEIDRLREEAEILHTNVRRARGDVAVLREWHQIDLEEIERLRALVELVEPVYPQPLRITQLEEHVERLYAENEKLVEELDACHNGLANARAALRKTPEPPRDT